MDYQIYIPGCRGYGTHHLKEVGLGDLLDPHNPVAAGDVAAGPDGGAGIVFSWGDHPRRGYHADEQLWTPAKARGELPAARFWMGQTRNDPPRPADLERGQHLGGELARLADGREWLIPVARQLPHKFAIDDDGLPRRKICAEYQSFYDRAQEYFSLFVGWFNAGAKGDLNVPAAWQFALDALGFNYRVNADIVDWLGLLDDKSIIELIGATHEWRTFLDLNEKKKS